MVRRPSVGNYYLFDIVGDGKWEFGKVVNQQYSNILPYVPNSAIKTGLNVENTLKIQMSGAHFTFFINGSQVGQVGDTTFTTGKVGVAGNTHVEVAFNNFSIATPA